jgi:hypothetical protein
MNQQFESAQAADEATRVHAVAVTASSLLARALSPEVPDGSAIALGTNIVFYLRRNRVKSGQITFQVCGGEEKL